MEIETCPGRLEEPTPEAFACSLGYRCAAGMTLRSFYATRDAGLAEQYRRAHQDRGSRTS